MWFNGDKLCEAGGLNLISRKETVANRHFLQTRRFQAASFYMLTWFSTVIVTILTHHTTSRH